MKYYLVNGNTPHLEENLIKNLFWNHLLGLAALDFCLWMMRWLLEM